MNQIPDTSSINDLMENMKIHLDDIDEWLYAFWRCNQCENNYVGISEDKEWIKKIEKCDSVEEIYNKLVQFCGIFRWQNAHGFRTRHYQGLQHIQPRFNNIKELSNMHEIYNLYILYLLFVFNPKTRFW